MYPRGVWAAATGLMERLITKLTSVPLAIYFFFSWKATFSSLWQQWRKCFQTVLNSSVSTIHSEKVCVFCEWRVFGLFLPVHHGRRSFFPPLSVVDEGGKDALSCWWGLLQSGLTGDFFAPFPLDFSKCTFETCTFIIIYFGMTFCSIVCSTMGPYFYLMYWIHDFL